MSVSRRDVITRGGLAALGAVVAVPSLGASPDLEADVREVIHDLRNMPGSTPYGTYMALQELGDRLERLVSTG